MDKNINLTDINNFGELIKTTIKENVKSLIKENIKDIIKEILLEEDIKDLIKKSLTETIKESLTKSTTMPISTEFDHTDDVRNILNKKRKLLTNNTFEPQKKSLGEKFIYIKPSMKIQYVDENDKKIGLITDVNGFPEKLTFPNNLFELQKQNILFYFQIGKYNFKQPYLFICSETDMYWIANNGFLYKMDNFNNLVIGVYRGVKQTWKTI